MVGKSAHGSQDTNLDAAVMVKLASLFAVVDNQMLIPHTVQLHYFQYRFGDSRMLRRIISVLAIIAVAELSYGQGTGRGFADPMSWQTLRDRLVLIAPSASQLEHMAIVHDQYLASMEDLRTSTLGSYLDETKGMGPFGVSDPDKASRIESMAKQIRRKIATYDDALFTNLSAIVGDAQQHGLDRARQRRTRDRLRRGTSGLMIFGGDSAATLVIEPRDIIDWATLDDDIASVLDADLTAWEDHYTALLTQHDVAAHKGLASMTKALSTIRSIESNMSDTQQPSPEDIQSIMGVYQDAQQQADEFTQPVVARLKNHGLNGLSGFASTLDSADGLALVKAALAGQRMRDRVASVSRRLRAADLTSEQQVVLRDILESWNRDAAELILEHQRAEWLDAEENSMQFVEASGDGMQFQMPQSEHASAVRKAWDTRHDHTIDALNSIAPDAISVDAERDYASSGNRTARTASSSSVMIIGSSSSADSDDGHQGSIVVSSSVSAGDGFPAGMLGSGQTLPAITQKTAEALSNDLSLDTETHERLVQLQITHDTARSELESAELSKRKAIKNEAKAKMESGEPIDQMQLAMIFMEPISSDGLDELDAAFFDGAEQLTQQPERVSPWRQARQRQRLLGGGGMLSMSMSIMDVPDDRWKVDLLGLVESSDLSVDDHIAARTILGPWHAAATALVEEYAALQAQVDEAMHKMMTSNTADSGGAINIDITAAMDVEASRGKMLARREALAELNQDTIDAILKASEGSEAIRRSWLIAAFPNVAEDDAFIPIYSQALSLDDLTDEQRSTIGVSQLEHEAEWWQAAEAMVTAITAAAKSTESDSEQAFYAVQRLRQELDRMTFARRETALKRLQSLRSVLTEAQLARAKGLLDPMQPQQLALPF